MALGDPAAGIDPVSFEIQYAAVPLLPGAREAAHEGMIPGGLKNNREFLEACVSFASSVPEEDRALLYDPQTSGGLLIAIARESAERAIAYLAERGIPAKRIGRVLPKGARLLHVL